MSLEQPGIAIFENILKSSIANQDSAIPIFIGFTEIGQTGKLYYYENFSGFEAELGGGHQLTTGNTNGSILYYTIRHFFNNGGRECFIYSIGNYEEIESLTFESFINKLSSEELQRSVSSENTITLLSVPELVLLDKLAADDDGTLWSNAWLAILKLCEYRQGIFGILDTPQDIKQVQKCIKMYSRNASSNRRAWTAAYWPRLTTDYTKPSILNSEGSQVSQKETSWITVPPSGAIAAKFGETDSSSGVWTAPANLPLSDVIRPTRKAVDAANLFSDTGVSVNIIKSIPGRGIRIWGCRTLADGLDKSWRYVQIRRLVGYIENSLSEVSRFAVFEPNTQITWMKLKGRISSWLRSLWMQGALAGTSEYDAFSVQIGLGESMNAEDIQEGKLIISIGLALLIPAEFIQINLQFKMGEELPSVTTF